MTIIYPGSFDPLTTGHLDIALRGAKLAGRLIVAVLDNPNKKTLFSVQERMMFLKEEIESENIEVDSFSGLLSEYAARKKADAILRGLRSPEDFYNENKYAVYNGALSETFSGNKIETVFISANPALSYVSSTITKEAAVHIYKNNLDDSFVKSLVPPSVREALRKKFS